MTNAGNKGASAGRFAVGRYEVLGEIAAGGMGRVLLAQLGGEGGFRRLVAVKLPHEHLKHEQAMIDRLLDEARIAAQVRHPHVVSIHEIGRSDEHGYFLVMDYVDGMSFSQVLPRLGHPRPERWALVLRVVIDALEGLAAAHETLDENGQPMNIVHRDLSPQNILVGVDGIGRVTDFGIAKAASRLAMTRTGQTVGKLGYMSPEQLQGGLVESASDLFSMGVVLWESIAARRLFSVTQDLQSLTRMLTDPIPALIDVAPGVPPALSAVAAKALQRDPYMRFRDAREMTAALERAAVEARILARTNDVATWMRTAFSQEIAARRQWIQNARPADRVQAADALPMVPGPSSGVAESIGDTDVTSVQPLREEATVKSSPVIRPSPSIDVPVMPAAPGSGGLRRNSSPRLPTADAPAGRERIPTGNFQGDRAGPPERATGPWVNPGGTMPLPLSRTGPGATSGQHAPGPYGAPPPGAVEPGGRAGVSNNPQGVPLIAVIVAAAAGVLCVLALAWFVAAR